MPSSIPAEAGHSVTLIDAGTRVGGRILTLHQDGETIDHSAKIEP